MMTAPIFIDPTAVAQAPLYHRPVTELTVVIASLALGGAERIVLDWAARIYPRWTVHLVVLRNQLVEWPVPKSIRLTRLEDAATLDRLRTLPDLGSQRLAQLYAFGATLALSSNPVCLCHLLNEAERSALAFSGATVIPVLHNARDGWSESAEKLAGAETVLAVSDACRQDLLACGWDGHVSVIRHIPAMRWFTGGTREECRRAWRIPQDATVIGMLGAVKSQKNYTRALEILKEVHLTQDAYLVILGGPANTVKGKACWEQVVATIHELGLRNRVAMPGFIPDGARCLSAVDVLLNTSHYEGLSIASLEALLGSIPVVASKVGGQGELACDGLRLLELTATNATWAAEVLAACRQKISEPPWKRFPSYRLWTLHSLVRKTEVLPKLLFVTANLNSGGAQRSLVNLATALPDKSLFEVIVAGNSTDTFFYRKLQQAGVTVSRSDDTRDAFANAESIVQKVCAERLGTVCFWNLDPKVKLLVTKVLKHTTVKIIDVSPGNYAFEEMQALETFGDLIAFSQADYEARLDQLVLKYHGEVQAHLRAKTTIIPNGVFIPKKQKTVYDFDQKPKIVVNGRIARSKFIIEIIEAFRLIRKQFPAAQLHFLGGVEPLQEEYGREVIKHAAADAAIKFRGVTSDAGECLWRYDLQLILGKNQGCPNALLEALSSGVPVIANDDGGTAEQLVKNTEVFGLLIKSREPAELAEAAIQLLKDRQLAEKLASAGKIRAQAEFSMQAMSSKYSALFWPDQQYASV